MIGIFSTTQIPGMIRIPGMSVIPGIISCDCDEWNARFAMT